jgi:hypothetical protein
MGWHQVPLRSLVGSCSREFVYELVYIRAVFCESTYDYRFYSIQLAQSALHTSESAWYVSLCAFIFC